MYKICVLRINARIFVVLIFGTVAGVIFVEYVVVIDQCIGCVGLKIEQ